MAKKKVQPTDAQPIPERLKEVLARLDKIADDLEGLGFQAQADKLNAALDLIEEVRDDFQAVFEGVEWRPSA